MILTKRARHFFAKRRKVVATNPMVVVTATFQFKSVRNKQQCFVMRGRDWDRTRVYIPLCLGSIRPGPARQSQNH